jgi:3-oxoacyl-[acyl-carrier protein] reductase
MVTLSAPQSTLAPKFTRTRMAQAFIDQYGEDYATSNIATMVAFLLSGLAGRATGSTIDLNAASYVR